MSDPKCPKEIVLHGVAASPGIACGKVFVFLHKEPEIPIYGINPQESVDEITRFEQALLKTRAQINKVRSEVAEKLSEDEAKIFDAHLLVLEDKALIEETIQEFRSSGLNIEHCFYEISKQYINAFGNIDDEYLKERVSDIKDVTKRVLMNLLGSQGPMVNRLADESVVVSEDLTPSDTASLDRAKVLGIVTDTGGRTSHGVIMARSLQVPAVVGLKEASLNVENGDLVLIDGYEGVFIINPTEETLSKYRQLKVEKENIKKFFEKSKDLPCETLDKIQLSLSTNAESVEEIDIVKDFKANGIGLYRTENVFLSQLHFPSEDEQFSVYKEIVDKTAPLPITIRTLDIGGDKKMGHTHFHIENNPFMGLRAIRFCLDNKELFKDQLRAILRVSISQNVRIMYPMVSNLDELVAANALLEECKKELEQKGVPFDSNIPVGAMVEVPSAAAIVDLFADHCSFISIGTNDLIQYMLAVDRVNERIAHLYEPNHPGVLRTIASIINLAHQGGMKVSVCGEMAGDPMYVPLLYGLGADDLSVSLSCFPEIKYLINHFELKKAKALAETVMQQRDAHTIFELLRDFYIDHVQLP